ncbi:Protein stn1 [Drechmeria coniospora]|uniref:Protein stn1 n=1 Tax=Drechmeria coniospora TaxID=98403 RepID=A0A151GD37_DRECN|nr:Protein stn1 [Drechmeria coniospora]KYK54981.1 Protein stn1 [Drechmeria coniospora]
MKDEAKAEIYPRYCFHLSPTVNKWCLFRACEIHALDQRPGFEGEGFYFHRNLPIKWVRIVGVVVAIDEYAGRRVYTIDDSSAACIEALVSLAATKDADGPSLYPDIDVGAVVDVKGSLSTFRNERQIKIEKMFLVRGTTQEVTLWEKRGTFRRDVLDTPWVLSLREVRRCRKEAERCEAAGEGSKRWLATTMSERTAVRTMKAQMPLSAGEPKDKKRGRDALGAVQELIRDGAVKGKYSALGL